MNWEVIIFGVLFVLLGLGTSIFGDRFGRWCGNLGLGLIEKYPWLNLSGMSKEEAEYQFYEKQPTKAFYRFWLWGMRLTGLLLVACGILLLLAVIFE